MKIFIAGSRGITNLNKPFEDRLHGIYEKDYYVLVGDANGVDKAVQKYFSNLNYQNVTVYASNGKARTNVGNWSVESVWVPESAKDFDFYAEKDKAMAHCADFGLMLWNGESRGTLTNIVNLLNRGKRVLVYFTPMSSFTNVDNFVKLELLIGFCGSNVQKLYERVNNNHAYSQQQISLFEGI